MPLMRRKLRFHTLGDILAEAQRLSAAPYDRAGTWELSQITMHLAGAFEKSIDGFEKPGPRGMGRIIGRIAMRGVLLAHRIPAGRPLSQEFVPTAEDDPRPAMARLKAAIDRFSTSPGPFAVHPIFGPTSKANWAAFHLVHSAHHLSFLVPQTAPSEKTL